MSNLTRREQFAVAVLQGLISDWSNFTHVLADALCKDAVRIADELIAELDRTAPVDDGWIEWKGGDRPVKDVVNVEVRTKDGELLKDQCMMFEWRHCGRLSDIIAYRIVEDV